MNETGKVPSFAIEERFFDSPMFVNFLESEEGKKCITAAAKRLAEEIDEDVLKSLK